MPERERVVIAMSGGVDSSVSAALLVEQGYDVMGIMMRLWSEPGQFDAQKDNRCCTRDQMLDAHFVAKKLGIPFEVIDAQEQFRQTVVEDFIRAYSQGRTPNPCLLCNREVRFGTLLDLALERGATHLATGHYARVSRAETGLYELRKGLDPTKDQSYVLSRIRQEQLKHAMFPLGGYTKKEIRAMAEELGLSVANKPDSQDLCFVADGDYRRFLRTYAETSFTPGPIKLRAGEVIGEHEGLPAYTIGQRKGLYISWSEPLYVIEKNAAENALIVGIKSELGKNHLRAVEMNWMDGSPPDGAISVEVKTRYKSQPVGAEVTPVAQDEIDVRLIEPLPDITPGQGAVLYDGDRVVGAGIIESASSR